MTYRDLAGAAAIALAVAGPLQAGGIETEPRMQIEDISDDTVASAGGVFVPVLFLIFALAVFTHGNGGELNGIVEFLLGVTGLSTEARHHALRAKSGFQRQTNQGRP